MSGEYKSLTGGHYGSSQKRGYGAAVPSTSGFRGGLSKPKSTISHKVTKSDSLNSLAVKYDTSISEIKRLNKLWSNESLSLRDFIDIPIHDDSNMNSKTQNGSTSHPGHKNGLSVDDVDMIDVSGSSMLNVELSSKNTVSDVTTSDFFAKFDKSLDLIKKKVEDQTNGAGSLSALEDDDVLYDSGKFKHRPLKHNGKGKGSLNSLNKSSSEDVRTTPEPVIRSKAKKKMEEHERHQNEELFQL